MARRFNETFAEYYARLVSLTDEEAEKLNDDDFTARSAAISDKLKLAAEARTRAKLAKEEEKKKRAEEEKAKRAAEMAKKKATAAELAQRKAEEKRAEELKRRTEDNPSPEGKGKEREGVAGPSKRARVAESETEEGEIVSGRSFCGFS